MFYTRNVVESGHFKRLDQGFIFQPPHPWVFGCSPRYLATDIQKAALLDVMAPEQPGWKRVARVVAFIVVGTLWLLAITTFLWALGPTDHHLPTALEGVMIMAATALPMLVAVYVALCLRARVLLRRLRPFLATLPHTDERIDQRDVRAAMIDHTSFKRLLVAIVVSAAGSVVQAFCLGFTFGLMLIKQSLSAATLPLAAIFTLLISLVLTAHLFVTLIRKAKRNMDRQLVG
jgi:hypothetical protein